MAVCDENCAICLDRNQIANYDGINQKNVALSKSLDLT
jgi:hypothetical protein